MAINRNTGSSAEMNCQWHFKSGVNFNVGPTDAAGQNFDGSWDSLVRECIQNSLDAVLDKTKPVTVQIKFCKISMANFGNFFGLREHIKACLETFPDSAQRMYGPMLNLFTRLQAPGQSMGYLKISDYNTKGMAYDPANDSCNFSAFVRGLGVHGGDQSAAGRGGSFGLGKSTIFTMSPIRTMLVSTLTSGGKFVFEGVSTLTTHRMGDKKYSHVGFYDNNKGEPITDLELIPRRFRRKGEFDDDPVPGTDIMIMGREEGAEDVDEITKAVLTHYWLAILLGRLKVRIASYNKPLIEINQDVLPELMDRFFSNPVDNYRKNINPRPYYDAVVKSGHEPGCVCFEENLFHLGKVKLYLLKNRDAKNDRIAFFRLPCMMVMRKGSGQLSLGISNYGVYGSFVCVSNKGDKMLKHLENPAHNEWDDKNWRDPITNRVNPEATVIVKELRDFLSSKIEEFCRIKDRSSLKMLGAGKYLYTFSDMVDSDSEDIPSQEMGIIAGSGYADTETGMRTTEFVNPPAITPASGAPDLRSGNVINNAGLATIEKEPKPNTKRTTAVITPPKKRHNNKTKRNTGGTTPREATVSDQPAAVLVDVEYKVCALRENGSIVHNVCIFSEEFVLSAKILFSAKREDGRLDNELEINDSFGFGSPQGMELNNVRLNKGANMLKIRFNDDVKHILDLNVTRLFQDS